MVLGDEKGRGPPLSRMALAPAGLQPDAAEWSGATGGNASAVLRFVTWENDEQAGGMALFAIASVLVESALGEAGRARSLSPSPTAAAFDAGHLGRGPALPGDVWRGAGAFWQRNEFRCSFPGPIGRQMSFGVVETLPARPMGPFWRNMRP